MNLTLLSLTSGSASFAPFLSGNSDFIGARICFTRSFSTFLITSGRFEIRDSKYDSFLSSVVRAQSLSNFIVRNRVEVSSDSIFSSVSFINCQNSLPGACLFVSASYSSGIHIESCFFSNARSEQRASVLAAESPSISINIQKSIVDSCWAPTNCVLLCESDLVLSDTTVVSSAHPMKPSDFGSISFRRSMHSNLNNFTKMATNANGAVLHDIRGTQLTIERSIFSNCIGSSLISHMSPHTHEDKFNFLLFKDSSTSTEALISYMGPITITHGLFFNVVGSIGFSRTAELVLKDSVFDSPPPDEDLTVLDASNVYSVEHPDEWLPTLSFQQQHGVFHTYSPNTEPLPQLTNNGQIRYIADLSDTQTERGLFISASVMFGLFLFLVLSTVVLLRINQVNLQIAVNKDKAASTSKQHNKDKKKRSINVV